MVSGLSGGSVHMRAGFLFVLQRSGGPHPHLRPLNHPVSNKCANRVCL